MVMCDVAENWALGLQDPASASAESVMELHDTIMFYIILIITFVFWMISSIIFNFNNNSITHKYSNHGTLLELIWTISPALILIAIAFPSFKLLYLLDEVISPSVSIKVIGHQWYWSYEYSDYLTEDGESIDFDSYLIPDSDLDSGFRLLSVDNPLVIPVNTHVRFIVTANDVIHSFAVPSLGIKLDCIPGRLNACSALAERIGTFYGQCSEICGVAHFSMPTMVRTVELNEYVTWLDSQLSSQSKEYKKK